MRTPLNPTRNTPALREAALLLTRIALGVILLAHGWQKYNEYTFGGTVGAFTDMGVPLPAVAAGFAIVVELVGGLALILGLLTPVFAALNIVNLLGALILVHAGNGMFVENGGYELVVALIAGLLIVVALGGGRFSVDHLIQRRLRTA